MKDRQKVQRKSNILDNISVTKFGVQVRRCPMLWVRGFVPRHQKSRTPQCHCCNMTRWCCHLDDMTDVVLLTRCEKPLIFSKQTAVKVIVSNNVECRGANLETIYREMLFSSLWCIHAFSSYWRQSAHRRMTTDKGKGFPLWSKFI